jgi:hypothetical protein
VKPHLEPVHTHKRQKIGVPQPKRHRHVVSGYLSSPYNTSGTFLLFY